MATVRGLDGLARRLKDIRKEFVEVAEDTVKKAITRAHQVAVVETRVKTGRAKGGWIISNGSKLPEPIPFDEQILDKSGGITLEKGSQEIAQFKLEIGEANITNNVEYIIHLEQGTPFTPADNMAEKAAMAARAFLREGKYLK